MKSLTPVLYVDAIEPCLPFWRERLGFEVTVEVPDGQRLGFVILRHGALELMLQTHASAEQDDPRLAAAVRGARSALYLEVDDLDAVEAKLSGVERLVPRRHTFYGADEIFVLAPGGHVVGFAHHGAPAGSPGS